MTRTGVVVLGSTGSVGTQALAVIARHPDRFRVVGLAARSNRDLLADQASRFDVPAGAVALVDDEPGALERLASDPAADVVLNAVVGASGLPATLAAVGAGKRLALANKESLITGGALVTGECERGGGEIIPVDSEHSAIWQCLRAGRPEEVAEIVLTASGGPFRGCSAADLAGVTVADALRHPTWAMGPKITVDSATLMNKGLEVIEAHYLFGVAYEALRVVVHPQSVVHGMVQFRDGSVIAHLQRPTMEGPIALALSAPDRLDDPVGVIDWSSLGSLTFEEPARDLFPCLDRAYEAGRRGGLAPAVLSAANEEAVAAFLGGSLPFTAIADVNGSVLAASPDFDVSLPAVEEAIGWARAAARTEMNLN